MTHRIKNLFALAASMMRLSLRGSATKEELAEKAAGRLQAFPMPTRSCAGISARSPGNVRIFAEILARILRPHDEGRSSLSGPAFAVGERATSNLALVFHELATNASKYGALSGDDGAVAVEWTMDEKDIRLLWQEAGGPLTRPPVTNGYGTRLVAATVQDFGGRIDYDWRPEGLAVRLHLPLASLDA